MALSFSQINTIISIDSRSPRPLAAIHHGNERKASFAGSMIELNRWSSLWKPLEAQSDFDLWNHEDSRSSLWRPPDYESAIAKPAGGIDGASQWQPHDSQSELWKPEQDDGTSQYLHGAKLHLLTLGYIFLIQHALMNMLTKLQSMPSNLPSQLRNIDRKHIARLDS